MWRRAGGWVLFTIAAGRGDLKGVNAASRARSSEGAGLRETLLEIYVPRYGDAWEQFIDPPDGEDAPVYFRIEADKMFSFQMVGEPSL